MVAIVAVFVVIAAIIGGLLWYLCNSNAIPVDTTEKRQGYDSKQKVQEALEKLKSTDGTVEVINQIDTSKRVIALTLDGMVNDSQMKEIVSLLEANDVQATFFVEGIEAAESDDTVVAITEKGFEVECYTLRGDKHMEELTPEEMTEDFVKAKTVLESIMGRETSILKCNNSKLTQELLHAAQASGYTSVVESTAVLSSTSLSSKEEALGYVQRIRSGSIISVKLNEQLDLDEVETKKEAAKDKKATISTQEVVKSEPADIVTMLSYLIGALHDANVKTIFVKDISGYSDSNFGKEFDQIEADLYGAMADAYTSIPVVHNWIGCSFRGIKNGEMLDQVLELLKKTESHAAFFVSASDIESYPERIQKILEQGHTIENGGYAGIAVTGLPFSNAYLEIEDCDKILKEKFSIESQIYMPIYGKFDITTRKAAKALDYAIVTYNKNPITDKNKSVEEIMLYFETGLKKGDIVFFDLDYYNDMPQVLESVIMLAQSSKLSMVSTTEMFRNMMELQTYFDILRVDNAGKLANTTKDIKIVDDSVVFTFYGIAKPAVVNDVLAKLASMNAKATFFIDTEELVLYADSVQKIKNAGHEIGIAIQSAEDTTFEQSCRMIYETSERLKSEYGMDAKVVMQPFGDVTNVMKEAISAMGYTLVGYDTSVVHNRHLNEKSAQQVVDDVFGDKHVALRQGQILSFRMDYYNSNKLLGEVIVTIKQQLMDSICYQPSDNRVTAGNKYNGYQIIGIQSLLSKTNKMYQYPLNNNKILAAVKDKVKLGELPAGQFMNMLKEYYIGASFTKSTDEFVGFSDAEMQQIDRAGQVKTNDKVIFFTFDDWGSDAALNKLLNVLEKHGAKGVFFVRTNHIENNTNLLRKIVLAGHQVASHTDEHIALSNYNAQSGAYESLSNEQLEELKTDIVLSYKKLTQIIGDVSINGKPALTAWFRPPTLAISKPALETIYGCGYNYVISGNISTHDYEANSAIELYNQISTELVDSSGNLKKGSIIILHMSDNAQYTAEAIDLLMTNNATKADDDPTKFIVGNLSDYLNGK